MLDKLPIVLPVFVSYEVAVYGLCDVWLQEEDLLTARQVIPPNSAPLINIGAETLHVQSLGIAAPVYT